MADTEREAFEAWAKPQSYWWNGQTYSDLHTQIAWDAWQAGSAFASRPAEVDDEGLPPLPKPWKTVLSKWVGPEYVEMYTAEQFRQGQRDAVAADRARREKLPANAAEMIAFIGSHYHFMRDMADPNDTVYELTVHDLLSSMSNWFEDE